MAALRTLATVEEIGMGGLLSIYPLEGWSKLVSLLQDERKHEIAMKNNRNDSAAWK